jgi:hypothetical protein
MVCNQRRRLFELFSPLTFAQSHTRSAAVFVDELDPGCFQGTPNRLVIGSRHGRLEVG